MGGLNNPAAVFTGLVIAVFVLVVAGFAWNGPAVTRWRERRRRDDLMDLADGLREQVAREDSEIERLRAIFHADQNPQPERRH